MIDFKNYERLTISKGEIMLYGEVYNKCSNQNAPEIREKINNGTLVCDIEEYQFCSYTTKELRDMYSRLSNLEDMIEQGKLVEKTEMRRFVEDVEKLLCDYLYENVNGENVMLVAPYLELMPKAKEITKKYGVEE